MKAVYFLIILFIGAFCRDYRWPTGTQIKCFKKYIGEGGVKKLLESFRKYHRSHGKATLLDYILDKRGDLKSISDECLLKISRRRRRLDKEENMDFVERIIKYYLDAILKDEKMKAQFSEALKKNKETAIEVCKKSMQNSELCAQIIEMMDKYSK